MALTLQNAIDDLYRLAVAEGKAQSPLRLESLARYCAEQLEALGLAGAKTEVKLEGAGRPKAWDVAWLYDSKVRLVLSLKSLLRNIPGTVPNRLDDMMGEVANLQLYSPEVVVGYLMVFDTQQDRERQADGLQWSEFLEQRLAGLAGRRPPAWTIGTIEAVQLIRVDFSAGAKLLTAEAELQQMFATLAAQVRQRNPGFGAP